MALLLGYVHVGLVDRLGGGFATDCLDVARLVVDVLDIDVDDGQADLLQFNRDSLVDLGHERLAVAIDVVDLHRGDDSAHLPQDDVLRLGLNLLLS